MSAEKNVTLSKVIIIVKGLLSALQKIQEATHNAQAKTLIIHYEHEILRRFSTSETNFLMAKCAILDPRFKSKVFGSEPNLKMAKERLENDVARLISLESQKITIDENIVIETVTTDVKENLIWADFDKLVQKRSAIDPKAAAIIEVRSYLAEDLIHRKDNPMDW